nr:PREDICTED: serine/threonine-protein kinase RIO1-like [Daucus carota subsp. sativus]
MEWEEIDIEIGEALDRLDCMKDDGVIHLYSTKPNRSSLSSTTFQPISNRNQKFAAHLLPQAIDQTTRMVVFKLLNHAIFDDLNACIFAGKQASVYHATKHDGQEFAVKVFKDRDHNTQGHYRSRRGNFKSNSRKIVKTWAENEMKNLMRLKAAGIRCPTPIVLRLHVVVMEFIGKSGSPAPCLKDANLSVDKMRECYIQMIIVMRNLYQKCKLVHGDLSEYNILYHEGDLHITDVSRSVDLDDPLFLDLLYWDCIHVSGFFKKNGVEVIAISYLFNFVVDSSIPDESVGCYIEESDIPRVRSGQEELITSGFLIEHTNNRRTESRTGENEVGGDDDSSDSGVNPYDTMKEGTQRTLPADKKAARKENKKKVKEEKREARKTKTAKYVKKKKNSVKRTSKPTNTISRFL